MRTVATSFPACAFFLLTINALVLASPETTSAQSTCSDGGLCQDRSGAFMLQNSSALTRLDSTDHALNGDPEGAQPITLDGSTTGTPPDCDQAKRMSFGKANVAYSNLGGEGPDSGEEGILYKNVMADSGKNIDLHVRAISEYTPNAASQNGKVRSFGRINLATGSEVALEFEFQDGATHLPVLMDPFTMTFVDLDEQKEEGYGKESITMHDELEYIVSANTAVHVVTVDGSSTFSSTQFGAGSDNPKDVMQLTQAQKDKSFQAVFPEVSMLTVTFSAGPTPPKSSGSGRNILFAGQSNMMCPPDSPLPPAALCETMTCPNGWKLKKKKRIDGVFCAAETCTASEDRGTCCQADLCSSARRLTLRGEKLSLNNLGNQGPGSGEEGMLFEDVFPDSGDTVNMLVSAAEGYEKNLDGVDNGVKDKIAKVNLKTGGTADLTFSFFDGNTGEPTKPGPFYLSFLDFDEQQEEGRAREFITLSTFNRYEISENSVVQAVRADAEGKSVTFHSTTRGTGEDNVKNIMHMTEEQKAKSVSVVIPQVSEFDLTFRVGALPKGSNARNIQFAGATSLMC